MRDPLLEDLLTQVEHSGRPLDVEIIQKAWEMADIAHAGQFRLSGEPYIHHPTLVAKTLVNWNLDTTTIVAGLLHDTVEDTTVTSADLVSEFGPEVARIVEGVTKVTDIHLKGSTNERFVENLRKMIFVMAKDLRVVLVKLADRTHNMRTIQYLSPEKRLINSKETLEIYAPLAERLGMGNVKGELEDLAFPYVYPAQYERLLVDTKNIYKDSEAYIEKFKRHLLTLVSTQIPNATISVRRKHLYSLYRKLQRPEIDGDITKIHDIVAARILVNSLEQCYVALGLVHGKFHPVPYLGIRDFIATPKPNGYRSIHTRIFGPEGKILEIQIRTYDMHHEAEMGIAAHWQYSEKKSTGASDTQLEKGIISPAKKLSWVKQLLAWQTQIADHEEFLNSLKFDAFQNRILAFSPMGDVYDLPRGAVALDFAYAVHTKLGHHAIGAKVNNKMASLDSVLRDGDLVEILIDRKHPQPKQKWLEYVVTTAARHSISKALNQ